jgi:hypothetical protein
MKEEEQCAPPHACERGLSLCLQLADALFNGFHFFPQALKMLLQPGDLFCSGPENPVRWRMSATCAAAAVVAAALTATVMFLGRAAHILTPLYIIVSQVE